MYCVLYVPPKSLQNSWCIEVRTHFAQALNSWHGSVVIFYWQTLFFFVLCEFFFICYTQFSLNTRFIFVTRKFHVNKNQKREIFLSRYHYQTFFRYLQIYGLHYDFTQTFRVNHNSNIVIHSNILFIHLWMHFWMMFLCSYKNIN